MDASTRGGARKDIGDPSGPQGRGPSKQPVRVIVTDDRRLCRESLRLLIEASEPSFDVIEAVGADDILELDGGDAYLSVILYNLPATAEDGLQQVKALRDAVPALPFMVVCDLDDPRLVRGAFARGASAFLPATTPGPIMVAVLNLVIAGGQYAPPSLFVDSASGQRRGAGDKPSLALREAVIGKAFPQLTRRQSGVLSLMSLGYSNRAIAEKLDMRENTVKAHVKQIMRRLDVENRTQAALLADRLVV